MGLFSSKEEKAAKKAKKEKEKQEFEAKHGKSISYLSGKYMGGNLPFKANEDVSITCYENDVILHSAMSLWVHDNDLVIPYNRLEPFSIKTEEQIEKDVTLTRLLLVGIFAFGLKKKKVTKSQYLVLSGTDETDSVTNAIFEIDRLSAMNINRANEARKTFLINNPSESTKEIARDENQSAVDPIEQIKKLAELKQIGAITEEEFEAKKSELLSRV